MPPIYTIAEEAMRLLDLGLALTPCEGKRPILEGWHEQRLGREELRELLTGTKRNIALVLNLSELVDIECDQPEAEANLLHLLGGKAPSTPTWRSKRGNHRLFRRAAGLPRKAKVELAGIEFRLGSNGKGAASILPPSLHPDGVRYSWQPGLSIHQVKPVELPATIIDRLNHSAKPRAISAARGIIPEGKRNDQLFKVACRLIRSGLQGQAVLSELLAENTARCQPPLEAGEVAAIAHSAEQRQGLSFTNFTEREAEHDGEIKKLKVGKTVTEIGESLLALTSGWPKRLDKLLFATKDLRPVWLPRAEDLFAWIGAQLDEPIQWAGGIDKVNKKEFLASLQHTAEHFGAIAPFPHCPSMAGHFYLHPAPTGGDGAAFQALLDRFQPATAFDRDLIHAAFLTLLWGGAPGSRPTFLIEAENDDGQGGRGAGKTTIPKLAGYLVGGHIDLRPGDDFDKLLRRLLTPSALAYRVALLDNIKTLRFSWADLEGIITNDWINGYQLYVGDGRRPNTITWFITLNNASLSKDMAQRCVIIRVKRPVRFSPTWENEVRDYIDANRWAIVGDLLVQLAGTKPRLDRFSRWAAWEQEVLACVSDPTACRQLILQRQASVDGDQEEADLVRDAFVAALRHRRHDPATEVVFIPTQEAAQIVNQATGENKPPQRASAYLQTLAIPELRKSNASGGERGWRWTGKNSQLNQPAVRLRAIQFQIGKGRQ